MTIKKTKAILIIGMFVISQIALAGKKPLKVYILAGQSNMQGMAHVGTVPRMALSPESKGLHDKILDKDGKPRVYKNVYITAVSQGAKRVDMAKQGNLTVGYGAALEGNGVLGPELGFGITMGEDAGEPILIIKTAWGGKSLNKDFRPPSAGPLALVRTRSNRRWKKEKLEEETAKLQKSVGAYYRLMMGHVKTVLANPGKYCAAYDPKQGYEIAGFAWFQGYNDRFYYPGSYNYYTELLAHFIRDVRKELDAPKMPFAIGVIGLGGKGQANQKELELRKAMAATAEIPEFKGTVVAVNTADFWDVEMLAARKKAGQAKYLVSSSEAWKALGTVAPEKRQWTYTSFELAEGEKVYRYLKKGEKGDRRTLTGQTSAALKDWLNPTFDTSTWQTGVAPIGKGKWEGKQKKHEEKDKKRIRSPWGDGDILLMKSSFELSEAMGRCRLRIFCTGAFLVYLNGNLVRGFPWPGKEKYRLYDIDAKHLKQGTNHFAFYTVMPDHGLRYFNAVEPTLEGLLRSVSDELMTKANAICTPRDHALAKAKSNGDFHYYGSAYTYSLIGEALAKAIVNLRKQELPNE